MLLLVLVVVVVVCVVGAGGCRGDGISEWVCVCHDECQQNVHEPVRRFIRFQATSGATTTSYEQESPDLSFTLASDKCQAGGRPV